MMKLTAIFNYPVFIILSLIFFSCGRPSTSVNSEEYKEYNLKSIIIPTQAFQESDKELPIIKSILSQYSIDSLKRILICYQLISNNSLSPICNDSISYSKDLLLKAYKWHSYKMRTKDSNYYHALYDNRKDLWEIDDETIRKSASSVCIIVDKTQLKQISNDSYKFKMICFGSTNNLCPDEKFWQQSCTSANGSGFAADSLHVITASHCIGEMTKKGMRVVFGFSEDTNSTGEYIVKTENIFSVESCKLGRNVNNQYPDGDYAILKLDHSIPPSRIAELSNSEPSKTDILYLVGHPYGLPLKVMINGKLRGDRDDRHHEVEISTYKGCSGAPVFNYKTKKVIGINLGEGEYEFTRDVYHSLNVT
jgi:hypothetical protein